MDRHTEMPSFHVHWILFETKHISLVQELDLEGMVGKKHVSVLILLLCQYLEMYIVQ